MRVALTGAAGFLGGAVRGALVARGHSIIELVRRPQPARDDRIAARRYDLAEPPDETLLAGADAVVHCAFARAQRGGSAAFATNVDGTLRLFERAAAREIPFLFVSSLSALPDARSVYGRQKFALEAALAPRGACIVRPGLIVGNGGLVASLADTMRRRHVLPLVDGGTQPVQCVWYEDAAALLCALIERGCPPRTLTVAAEPATTVGELARAVRRSLGLRAPAVTLPFALVYAAAAALEFAGLTPPLTTENLRGLQRVRVIRPDDVAPFGVTLLPIAGQIARLAAEFARVQPVAEPGVS